MTKPREDEIEDQPYEGEPDFDSSASEDGAQDDLEEEQ